MAFQNNPSSRAKKGDKKFVRIGTDLAAAELIRHGITTTVDMYFFWMKSRSLGEAGLRAIITQGTIDFPSPDQGQDLTTIEPGLRRLLKAIEKFRAYRPHHTLLLRRETPLHGEGIVTTRLTIHVGETRAEVEESLKKYGMNPFERMEKLGITGPNSIFPHCVHATDKDIELLVRTQTSVSHCPKSNMKLGAGILPSS